MPIPTDSRRELYGFQVICEASGLSYSDLIWRRRYPSTAAKPSDAWPFQRAALEPATNITPMKRKKP